jgi:hypothetical protein
VGFGAGLNSVCPVRAKLFVPTSLEEIETMPKPNAVQLFDATDHLYEALRILNAVLIEIEPGPMRGIEISKSLGTAWFHVNWCRETLEMALHERQSQEA